MPKIPQYTKEQLDKALENVSQGISVRTAAQKYGIPRATLQFKLKHPDSKSEFGPEPYLTREEEKQLEEWLCDMGKRGFPRNAEDILDSVQNFLNKNPRETPFSENRPGKGWLKGFLKRHPRITKRTCEAVTQASACISESDIRNWFAQIMDHINKSNLTHILDDPSRIFNADESGFQTFPSTGKVFAEKGDKNIYIIDKGKAKENMTVLFTISADGQMVLPTIVYPYQRLPERIKQTVPDDWGVATSSSGWMTADTFKYIIKHVFHPFLVRNNIQLPVLLFVDGHKSHLT